MLKRPRDAFDTSPASSTPPGGRLSKTMKHYHIDSDAFSDASAFHLPSDSPSNPFGRVKPYIPRDLPAPSPLNDHLVLRFQLAQQKHSVYRVATVPANYTFWHLHRLTQFLFGWKDYRREKHPNHSFLRIERHVEHLFTVKKRISFHVKPKHAGLFYEGTTAMRVAGNIEELKLQFNDDIPWEREERCTISHVWNRPSSTSNLLRGVVYEYDVLSCRKAIVHISLFSDIDKVKSFVQSEEELMSTPYVVAGSGLPDDDDDDEDFALDLQQFNEPGAFKNFVRSQEGPEEDQEDECPSIVRLAEEQALAKRRMSAPLPEYFPLDDEDREDVDEENLPPKQQDSEKDAAPPPRKRMNRRRLIPDAIELGDAGESNEVSAVYLAARGPSPVKQRSDARAVLPDPEDDEAVKVYDDALRQEVVTGKRVPFAPRLSEVAESCDVLPKAPHKAKPFPPCQEHSHEHRPARMYDAVVNDAQRRRLPLQPRLPDPEESVEVGVAVPRVSRKRASFPPLGPERRENDALKALYAAARRRISAVPHLPDPGESREIGDDRPPLPVKRASHTRRVRSPPVADSFDASEACHGRVEQRKPSRQLCHQKSLPIVHRSIESSVKVEDENDENDEPAESEAEV